MCVLCAEGCQGNIRPRIGCRHVTEKAETIIKTKTGGGGGEGDGRKSAKGHGTGTFNCRMSVSIGRLQSQCKVHN